MKKWIIALAASTALLSASANASLLTAQASVTVSDANITLSDTGFDGAMTVSYSLPDVYPYFTQTADWTLGAQGFLSVFDTVNQEQDLDESGSIGFDLGSFSMASQVNAGSYEDAFGLFAMGVGSNTPTLEDVFNAANGVATQDLLPLVSGLLGNDPATMMLLGSVASILTFEIDMNASAALQQADSFVVNIGNLADAQSLAIAQGLNANLGTLDINFGGTAFLEATFVSTPAVLSIFALGIAGLLLRRRV
jgi:hypothetical protein